MAAVSAHEVLELSVLSDLSEAEGYIVSICFKTGPPRLVGIELEWTLHDRHDPRLRPELGRMRRALAGHAPATLDPDSPGLPLTHGGVVTVEPGGQVEISTPPAASLAQLVSHTRADIAELDALLAAEDLVRGDSALDPHRFPHLLLDTPRYRAMREAFDRDGPDGRTMMAATAGLQVSLDAGRPDRLASRWAAVHALGPVLLAAFANSDRDAAGPTGWRSSRMRSWLGIDPRRAAPVGGGRGLDPARDWARYALAAPVICRRRPGADWGVPPGLTFGDWIRDRGRPRPTLADLDYHLSTLFPLVRPRGYLELRYLDTQPGDGWLAPVALLAGLGVHDDLLDEAREVCEPVRDRWREAAHLGLDHPPLAAAARALADVAARAVAATDLPPPERATTTEAVLRHLTPTERP